MNNWIISGTLAFLGFYIGDFTTHQIIGIGLLFWASNIENEAKAERRESLRHVSD